MLFLPKTHFFLVKSGEKPKFRHFFIKYVPLLLNMMSWSQLTKFWSFCRTVGLTTQQILEALEEYDRQDACNVVLFPPDEGEVSDVDSDGEDWGVKDPNHVGKNF